MIVGITLAWRALLVLGENEKKDTLITKALEVRLAPEGTLYETPHICPAFSILSLFQEPAYSPPIWPFITYLSVDTYAVTNYVIVHHS